MKAYKLEPPVVLDSARVLKYAILDQSVVHTGRSTLIVGGKVLGPVPCLAICKNLWRSNDFLLLYCNNKWRVLGAAGYKSLKLTLQNAEVAYAGVSGKWQTFRKLSTLEIANVRKVRTYLRNLKLKEDGPSPPWARGRKRATKSIRLT